MQRKSSFSYP